MASATSMPTGGGRGRDTSAGSERHLKKAMHKLYHFPKPRSSSTGGSKPSSSTSAPRQRAVCVFSRELQEKSLSSSLVKKQRSAPSYF